MKTRLAGLVLVMFFIFSFCAGQTQSQDVLYLKNGSIIRGTVVELVPEKSVKIKAADGSLFVYTMAEVEKLVKEERASQGDDQLSQAQDQQEIKSGASDDGSGFSLFGGVALPMGDFGSTSSSNGGAAKTGYAVGADGSLGFAPALAWITSVNVAVNSLDAAAISGGSGLSIEAGSWTSVWGLTGVKAFGYVSPDVQVFGFAQAGLLFGSSPEVTLTYGSAKVTQGSGSATAFGYGFGGGMTVSHFAFGVRYWGGEPEYEVTASGMGQSASGKFKQPTSCIAIVAGVSF